MTRDDDFLPFDEQDWGRRGSLHSIARAQRWMLALALLHLATFAVALMPFVTRDKTMVKLAIVPFFLVVVFAFTRTHELAELIASLPEWSSEQRDFTAAEWDRYLAAARCVQQTNPIIVGNALEEFYFFDTRPYILSRVVFDLPEKEGTGGGPAGWQGRSLPGGGASRKTTAAWPIHWGSDGRPELVACYDGFMGSVPRPVEEYQWMVKRLGFRKLPAVSQASN